MARWCGRSPDCSTTSGRPCSPVSVRIVASVGNTARWKTWSQIVEREAEVDVLGAIELVVNAVEVGADEDPLQRAEPEVGVRVLERHEARVADEQRRRQGAVGHEHDPRDQRHEIRHVDQGMGPEHGEHAHVLLGVVQLVETPEHPDPVVGEVREPVATVHRDEDQRDDDPSRQEAESRHDDPPDVPSRDRGERQREGHHQGHDQRRVEHRVDGVLSMAAGDQRPDLGWSHPLDDEDDRQDAERQRTDDHHPLVGHRSGEAHPTPMARPADGDQREGGHHDRDGRQIDPPCIDGWWRPDLSALGESARTPPHHRLLPTSPWWCSSSPRSRTWSTRSWSSCPPSSWATRNTRPQPRRGQRCMRPARPDGAGAADAVKGMGSRWWGSGSS